MINYCQNCGEEFQVVRYKQIFCSRRCFKQNYINKLKEEKPPIFLCSNCGKSSKLEFNPKKEKERWKSFSCPICKAERPKDELNN